MAVRCPIAEGGRGRPATWRASCWRRRGLIFFDCVSFDWAARHTRAADANYRARGGSGFPKPRKACGADVKKVRPWKSERSAGGITVSIIGEVGPPHAVIHHDAAVRMPQAAVAQNPAKPRPGGAHAARHRRRKGICHLRPVDPECRPDLAAPSMMPCDARWTLWDTLHGASPEEHDRPTEGRRHHVLHRIASIIGFHKGCISTGQQGQGHPAKSCAANRQSDARNL